MFFGLIGTLGLLTFPYVSSISLPRNSISIPTLFVQPFQLYCHNRVQFSHSFDFLFYLSFQSLANNFSLFALHPPSSPLTLLLSFPMSLSPYRSSFPPSLIPSLPLHFFLLLLFWASWKNTFLTSLKIHDFQLHLDDEAV